MSDEWHVYDGGQQYGPYSKSEIASMIGEGRVSAAAQVWREGMAGWAPVATVIPPQGAQMLPVQTPMQPKPRRPKRSASKPIYIGAIAVGVLAMGFVAWSFIRSSPIGSIVRTDPGFEFTEGSGEVGCCGYRITNTEKSPLTVYRVKVNDEYDCPRGRRFSGSFQVDYMEDKKLEIPVTLSIGESTVFVQRSATLEGYAKTAIFVDIGTNRRKFQYRDGQLR